MQTVFVEIRGGVVQQLYSDEADLEVVIVDWDDFDARAPSAVCHSHRVLETKYLPSSTREALNRDLDSL